MTGRIGHLKDYKLKIHFRVKGMNKKCNILCVAISYKIMVFF